MKKKHIIFYSGGLGSYGTAERVIERHGTEDLILLFTDTLIESNDLYRFIIETSGAFYNIDKSIIESLSKESKEIPEVHESMPERKIKLEELRLKTIKSIPNLIWLSDGIDPWDIFFEQKFLGNSRIAQCSHILKQVMSKKYIKDNFEPEEVILYLGIDWTEEHRKNAPTKNWLPYEVQFPMCEEPYVNKIDDIKKLEKRGIKPCELYEMKFVHSNCGGFCVRAGQGHFVNLLEQDPKLFAYHEQRERERLENILEKMYLFLENKRIKLDIIIL